MPKPTFELTIAGLVAVGIDDKHPGGPHRDTQAIVPPGVHKPRLAVPADDISRIPNLPYLSVVAAGGEGWAVFDVSNLEMRINPREAPGYEQDPIGFSTVGVSSKVGLRGEHDTAEWDDLGYVANLSWCAPGAGFKSLSAAPRIASLVLDRGELRSLRPTSRKVKEITWKFESGQDQQVVDGSVVGRCTGPAVVRLDVDGRVGQSGPDHLGPPVGSSLEDLLLRRRHRRFEGHVDREELD